MKNLVDKLTRRKETHVKDVRMTFTHLADGAVRIRAAKVHGPEDDMYVAKAILWLDGDNARMAFDSDKDPKTQPSVAVQIRAYHDNATNDVLILDGIQRLAQGEITSALIRKAGAKIVLSEWQQKVAAATAEVSRAVLIAQVVKPK